MRNEPTKADLLARIADMEAARRETPQDALVRALAELIANRDSALFIKHAFYNNGNGNLQLSLDMHEGAQ